MNRVIVVGSANTDLTVQVVKLPAQGETVMGQDFRVFFGGKGANQALAALRCGAEVLFIARIGTDPYGQNLAQHLEDSGLSVTGAFLLTKDHRQHIPACPVQAVDTVGAGDAFNGALAAALAQGCTLDKAVRLASAAGALAATKPGAQDSLPGRSDVETLAGLQFN